MPASTRSGLPITQAMRVRARELGVAALERLDDYGMEDRRESAFALLLGAAAPLAGMTLLHWPPKTVMVSLLLNLLLALADDLAKVVQSRGRRAQALKDRVEDEYVWPMARLMMRRRQVTYNGSLPTEVDLAQGRSNTPLWFTIPFALVGAGLSLLLLQADGSIYLEQEALLFGSAPSLLLVVVVSFLHRFNRHRQWRMAGSVRAQTTGHTALMTGYIGMGGVFLLGMSRDPPFTDRQLAWIFCAVVIAYGLFRVWQLLRLRESARYLRQSIRQMGVRGLAV